MASKLKIPKRDFLVKYINKHSQYSRDEKWTRWYSGVAVLKGKRTVKMLREYKDPNARLLDLGCGIGLTLFIVAQEFPNSVGCDIDKKAIEATKTILRKVSVSIPVIKYGGKKLPFKDNSFDVVTSIEVIEHVENPDLMLAEIRRVLKPNGILHVTTANKWWPYEPHFKLLFLSYLPIGLADWYVRISEKGGSYENIRLPSYSEFKKMVDKHFIVEDITLDMIKNYKKYKFEEERGFKVIIVGDLLNLLDKIEAITGGKYISSIVKRILIRMSLGWLFVARPKKSQK